MYIDMWIHLYVCMYVYVHGNIYRYRCISSCIYVLFITIDVYLDVFAHLYLYVCMYVCISIYGYTCMYVCMYMLIATQKLGPMPDVKTYDIMPQPEVKITDAGSRIVVVGGCTIRHNEVMYVRPSLIQIGFQLHFS